MWCRSFSLQWLLLLWSTVKVKRELSTWGLPALERQFSTCITKASHSTARGIFLDQGLNPCFLHWQANAYPLHHQGSCSTHCLNGLLCFFFFHSELSEFFISAVTRHFWHQGLVSWKTVFLWTRGWEWFQNNSNVLHLLCTLFLLLLHQPHLTSSDIISLNLGLPALNILVSNPFFGHIVGRFSPVSKWPFV